MDNRAAVDNDGRTSVRRPGRVCRLAPVLSGHGVWLFRCRQRVANGLSVGTISRPSGSSDTGISLKSAMPNGMPMTVRHRAMPATMWVRASHQPARISHRTLPMQEGAPASRRSTVVYPKGHSA